MNKTAELKSVVKGLVTGGILGAGAGVAATEQIQKNKYNARTVKSWNTRRRNSITKKAEEKDSVAEVKRVVRAFGKNLDRPTYAIADYTRRSLLTKARKMIAHKVSKNDGH